jgi:hypothetical protein
MVRFANAPYELAASRRVDSHPGVNPTIEGPEVNPTIEGLEVNPTIEGPEVNPMPGGKPPG